MDEELRSRSARGSTLSRCHDDMSVLVSGLRRLHGQLLLWAMRITAEFQYYIYGEITCNNAEIGASNGLNVNIYRRMIGQSFASRRVHSPSQMANSKISSDLRVTWISVEAEVAQRKSGYSAIRSSLN